MPFLDYLVKKGVITQEENESMATDYQSGLFDLEGALEKKGISVNDLTKIKGEYLQMPVQVVDEANIPFDVLKYIPEESALHYGFVPIGIGDNVLEVGMTNPDNIEARDALQFISSKTNTPFKIFLISHKDFDKVIEGYKGLTGEVGKALSELETELVDTKKVDIEIKQSEDGKLTGFGKSGSFETQIIEDAPVTKIVAVVLRHAVEGAASDVHIEPVRGKLRVRFRVDGILYTSLFLPANIQSAVVARIKILANMKIDEKRKPQDGRFSARIGKSTIDFRVSTFPTYYGEKVVMRILDPEKGFIKLDDLGLLGKNLGYVKDAIKRPYGMILLTGPTGSGKTTTMYSMLSGLDMETKNVLSLEDPVEYSMDGMNQSQVRPEIGYDFANGLRTTLRQDPDIIMVGEIRDKETARLAVQAALTGHLVISTLHTNNAAGVIPRLIDMGVDPFLIAPTLILAIAQRLVRKLCPDARESVPVEGSIKVMLDKQFEDLPEEYRKDIKIPENVYKAGSSPECPGGTRGRIAVFEMLKMDSSIEKIILENPTEIAVSEQMRKQGMLSLKEDAILKAFNGDIPFEEVNKL